jgi:hypothetical protein
LGDGRYDFFESFDQNLGPQWTEYGVRGTGEIAVLPRGRVLRLEAGAKRGDEVGKACIVHEFPRTLGLGDVLEVAASFRIPEIRGGRISLIDIECKYCGVPVQPGIRLFVNPDRSVYLERAKLGLESSFPQTSGPRVPRDEWFDVRWRTVFGQGRDGRVSLWIDGEPVIDTAGANFPDSRVARRFGVSLTAEQYDRVQMGLTANSQPQPATLEMDDIAIMIRHDGA